MSEQVQHTPGPWRWRKQSGDDPHAFVFAGDYADEGEPDLYCEVISGNPDADARRIAAAVNACEGIQTEALEAGVVREMVEALEWFVQRSGLNDSEVDGLLIPPGDAAEIQRRFGAVLTKVRGEEGDAPGS